MQLRHGSESGNSTWLQPPERAFRQARPLAEGQKSADVKHDFTIPPPANQDSWRRGSNFPRDMQIFRLSRHHLAEGVEFPEKKCRFWCLRAVIWRRGFSSRKCHPIDGDFEPCRLCHVARAPGKPAEQDPMVSQNENVTDFAWPTR